MASIKDVTQRGSLSQNRTHAHGGKEQQTRIPAYKGGGSEIGNICGSSIYMSVSYEEFRKSGKK